MPTDREWPSSSFFPHLNHISSRLSRSLWELRFDLVSPQLPTMPYTYHFSRLKSTLHFSIYKRNGVLCVRIRAGG